MYQQETIKPYHAGEKAAQVEQMFDNIAPTYDKLNHRLSWDIDKGWRKKAIRQLEPHKPQTLLDIATGTGDFAILAAEMLKPGGHLSIVELTSPVSTPMKQLFHVYAHTVLPVYGRLISKDTSAYTYLTKTIEAFPQGEQMTDILKKAGFREAAFKRLTFGICTMYFATK